MEAVQIRNDQESAYTLDDAFHSLLEKLDEAIDDLEQGRVISEEEMWAELDKV